MFTNSDSERDFLFDSELSMDISEQNGESKDEEGATYTWLLLFLGYTFCNIVGTERALNTGFVAQKGCRLTQEDLLSSQLSPIKPGRQLHV